MIRKLHLQNFAAFSELSIDFSPGINIIIGENGTGKTQLLKAVLTLCGPSSHSEHPEEQLAHKLCRLYQPLGEKVGSLRRTGTRKNAVLKAMFASGQGVSARFGSTATQVKVSADAGDTPAEAIFVPTKEVLSLVRGLAAERPDQPTIERIFDDGYLDLARQLIKAGDDDLNAKIQFDPRFASIVPQLVRLIGGRYELHDGRLCFQAGAYVEKQGRSSSATKAPQSFEDSTLQFVSARSQLISSNMTAEGFRKIGMLQRLLSNGTLNPGTTGPLLWDEPESNLNPKLMKDLVQALLELARNGQQIILATHDYVLLKWFDLLVDKGKADHVVFHRLYRNDGDGDIQLESHTDYGIVGRSAISSAFAEIYDEDVKRALEND